MSKLSPMTDASRSSQTRSGLHERAKRIRSGTADYRRMLSDVRMKPPSQQTFLTKPLKRAAITGAVLEFPATTHASLTPVDHT